MAWLCLIRRNVAQLFNFYAQVKYFKKCCFKCACIVRIKNYKQTNLKLKLKYFPIRMLTCLI